MLHYEEARTGLGGDFLDEVDALAARIAERPLEFPLWKDARPYRKAVMLKRFPFVMYFRFSGDEVYVLAVAHGKREPGYWVSRDET
ncbi:MAG: type II toxin-antitoxin system RelE/ParE family toxin [Myxococcales bacterium]|nr:type II toxin-antitoxin system RelE/ParE family toxin [Myxococcales bacterium]